MVRRLRSIGISGRLRRLQERRRTESRPDEPDPATRAAAALVHASCPYDDFWRYLTFWGGVCRVIFRHERDLAPPDILYFWVSIFGVDDLGGDLCGDHDTPLLLPVV